jgi:glycosyltransferase involved in cell wall biosynthesis
MIRFIKQPELIKKLGDESRKRAVALFDKQIVFKKTREIYNK